MKALLRTFSVILLFMSCTLIVRADGGYSFDITSDQKRLDGKTGSGGIGITSSTEHWCYKVTLVNGSFKDAQNVEIKYLTFMRPDKAGDKIQPGSSNLKRSKPGDVTVPVIKNLEKYEFNTDPMTLIATQLKAGYGWANGAAPTTRDALRGLWLKVFVNGQQVAEYFTPSSLKDKETWDAK